MGNNTIRDISCAGIQLEIAGIKIEDFVDDDSPLEISDCEVSKVEFSCNGRMVRTVKPTPIMLSVTVLAGSSSDSSLLGLWKKYHLLHNDEGLRAVITIPNDTMQVNSYTLINGTLVSATPGPTVRNSGKAQGRTYTFAFERAE